MRLTVKVDLAISGIIGNVNAYYVDAFENGAVSPINVLLGSGLQGSKMVAVEANLSLTDNSVYENGVESFSVTVSPADEAGTTVKGIQPIATGFGKEEAETATFYFNQGRWVDPLYCPQGFEVSALQIRFPRYLSAGPAAPRLQGTLTFVFE